MNTGGSRFTDVSAVSGLDFDDDGRGVSVVDWDHDGDLDFWIANRSGPQVRFLRNDMPVGHWLAVRLIGVRSNRDAIGARIELYSKGQSGKMIRSLRAGDGFLSQSSKWIHFGLGQATQIDRLVIRWPAGETEIYHDLEPDRYYVLTEGDGQPKIWTAPLRQINLVPSRLVKPLSTDEVQVFSAARTPLPRLTYTTLDGQAADHFEHLGNPVLLNLWASWCLPCVAELKEFVQEAPLVRSAGLKILALSVDGLGDEPAGGTQAARKLIEELDFPFIAGMASAQLLDMLQLVHDRTLFDHHQPLPVPTSILIDSTGNLAAIYKGRLSLNRLLTDVENLSVQSEARHLLSLPFAGRAFLSPWPSPLAHFTQILLEEELLDDAFDYFLRHKTKMALYPEYGQLLIEIGMAQLGRGDLEVAAAQFREALTLKNEIADVHHQLGVILILQEQFKEGIDHLQQALRIDPSHVDAHINLGNIRATDGEIDEAIEHYQNALRLDPGSLKVYNRLGLTLYLNGQHEEGIRYLRKAVEIEPNDADAHRNLGMALGKQGEFDESVKHLRHALAINPEVADIHQNLGVSLFAQRHFDEAIKHYHQALDIDPNHANTHNCLGEALVTLGQIKKAMHHLSKAVQIDPEFTTAHFNLAHGFHQLGRLDEAIEHYRQALKFGPPDGAAHNNLGVALTAKGQINEAIDHYRAAVQIRPNNPNFRRNLEMAQKAQVP